MSEIAGMLVSALGQGFIYAPMALGVFLTFSILKTPDLTVEGSCVFGMTSCGIIQSPVHLPVRRQGFAQDFYRQS